MGLTHYHSARAHGADIFVSPMGLNVLLNSRHPQGCDNFVIPMGLKMRLNSCHPQGCDIFVSPTGLKMMLNSLAVLNWQVKLRLRPTQKKERLMQQLVQQNSQLRVHWLPLKVVGDAIDREFEFYEFLYS